LRTILAHCKSNGIHVMIDETYVEFAADMADITAIPLLEEFDNLFVLRGISKFFAAPGLRLGYGMTSSHSTLSYIINNKNPWTLNSLAAVSGCQMFEDQDYIQRTQAFTHDEISRLCAVLRSEPGLYVYPPAANFILIRLLKEGLTSAIVFDHAIQKGLMLRDCSSFPGLGDNHIRFCLNTPEQNDRLVATIKELL
ncbi:MAG: aminotransferase class I/II-fold pyridoxal phosphate-dependent enzyme, partial [Pseudoflavonifractor sp.]